MGSTALLLPRELHPDSISELQLQAEGAGATVYRAVIPSVTSNDAVHVAVRKPRITSIVALERFEAELTLRSKLAHPHLLPLLAACTKPPTYYTVSPWMDGGTLFDALHAQSVRMSFERLMHLSLQFANAMAYMHKCNLVHRDLKTANLLLDERWENLVVADLDLAIDVNDLVTTASRNAGRAVHRGPSNGRLAHMVGTLVYMAPEVLSGQPHSFAADVYAFGITVNEMAACAVPFVDRHLPVPELHTVLETRFNEVQLRGAIVKNHLRPVLARGVPDDFKKLIQHCWHPDPTERPTFPTIVKALQEILARGPEYLAQFTGNTFDTDAHLAATSKNLAIDDANPLLDDIKAHVENPQKPIWEMRKHGLASMLSSGMDVDVPTKALQISSGLSSTCGQRGEDRMEDRSIAVEQVAGLPNTHLFAVFDGHGGQACSDFAANNFPGALFRAWTNENATPASALVHAFEDTDYTFLKATPGSEESGCTALAALVVDSTLYVANAGDCRCVLGKTNGNAVDLSKDHIATDSAERARIIARGGFVSVGGRVQGRLMISRALGDRPVKKYIASTPEITTRDIVADDDFIILASDGLWDVVSSHDAVTLVRSTVRVPDLAAKRLALKAVELGSDDNISVIVVFLAGSNSFHFL